MAQYFKFEVDKRFLPLLLPCGLRPTRDGVTLTETSLIAKLGLFKLETSLGNIDDAHVTRDYRWWTSIGPRLSFADDGLTLGTNNKAGVCVHFHQKVPSSLKKSGHSALTVTVSDLDGLAAALRR